MRVNYIEGTCNFMIILDKSSLKWPLRASTSVGLHHTHNIITYMIFKFISYQFRASTQSVISISDHGIEMADRSYTVIASTAYFCVIVPTVIPRIIIFQYIP